MKQNPAHALGMLAMFWLGVEVFSPPVKITQWSNDWGGNWVTQNARREFEKFGESEQWEVDYFLLLLESLLVLISILVGLSGLKKGSAEIAGGGDNSASRAFARCAVILHCGLFLLPLCSAGMDTIWLIHPFLLMLASPFLIPNLIAFLIAFKLCRWEGTPRGGLANKGWTKPFLVTLASLWSILLAIAAAPIFDVNTPLGGAMLGTLALWFTAMARASIPAPVGPMREG